MLRRLSRLFVILGISCFGLSILTGFSIHAAAPTLLRLGGFVSPTVLVRWSTQSKAGTGFNADESWEGKLDVSSNVPEVVDVLVSAGLSGLSETGKESYRPTSFWVRMNGQSQKIKKDTVFVTKLHVKPSSSGMVNGMKISVKPVGHNGRLPATVRNSEVVLVTIRIP